MESSMSTVTTPVYGIPIACSNCCELLFPITRNDSGDCGPNQGCENFPVYELTQEEQALAISSVLERIYRYEQLRDLNYYENGRVENAPLCQTCANILNQMDILHQEFDQLRGLESYISTQINKVDEIIRDRIVDLNLRLVTEDDNTTVFEDSPVVVKTEPEEPSKKLQPSGPWVVMKRLRPEDIPDRQVDPTEELPSVISLETVYKEKVLSLDTHEEDIPSCSYKKRRGTKRKGRRSVVQSIQLSDNGDTTAGKTNVAKKRKNVKASSQGVNKGKKEATKKAQPKKPKERRAKQPRLIDFYRRKQVYPYPCYYCHEDFEIESDRVEHLRGVHCTAHRTIICAPCGKIFSTEQGKKYHDSKCGIIPSHYVMPPYICNDCGIEFKRRFNLESHRKNIHSTERPFACDQCQHKTKSASALSLHKKYVHIVAEQVKCPECHKILKSQPVFEDHYRNMHTPEGYRRYKEIIKRRSVKVKEIYRRNRITTSVCTECNIDFQTVARYKNHRNEVHASTKKLKWQCEQCGKGFDNSWAFKKHQEFVHTDERPFICDQCGMRFKSFKNLRAHLERLHTEEGRLKYNEYDKLNYQRRQRLAQELRKAQGTTSGSLEGEALQIASLGSPASAPSTPDIPVPAVDLHIYFVENL